MSGHYPSQQLQDTVGYGVPTYPEQSQAVVALVLGLIGMFAFPLVAPFAWAIGRREISAIDGGRRPPGGKQMAMIGQILGIVMSVFLVLFVVVVFGLVVLALL